ncbi:hypothetical protein FSP39_001851 [Pinctada imbricata]|uniref:Uncharacterized protein n=1 Tax=Pinctada imbricata TaxID=66713 RepID=A0AA88YWS4_PINIB|nr:hypothetical protein FSP39_001851 [Pinctada imbricata]
MKKQLLCELNLADTAQGNVVFENDGDYAFISISGVQSHHKVNVSYFYSKYLIFVRNSASKFQSFEKSPFDQSL